MSSVTDVRTIFQNKLSENPDHGFHPLDLDRIKDEKYINRVLKHSNEDAKEAADMLWEIFTWRKTTGANEINESNIKMDFVHDGVIFPHSRDVDGCLLLIIKSKKHVKGVKDFEEIKRIIIYWFDRIEREENGNKISLFFDMEGCGLSNMDMDLIQYLISLFKHYYPNFLNYIIIYQMPWVLSAAFKIVKSLLPAQAIEKLKNVNKDTIKNFVPPEQALTCWGGQDNYVFEFVPENRSSPDHTPKKVTFAEQNDVLTFPHAGDMLRINPSNLIVFKNENDDITGQFVITNNNAGAVSFKIRTTSPEKFRVRPSSGILAVAASQTVMIVVQPGFQLKNVSKDMFLVMCMQIPKTELSQKELSEVWQNSSGNQVDEYRLKCQFPVKETKNGNVVEKSDKYDSVTNALNNLQINYEILHKQVEKLKIFQFLTLMLSIVAVILGYLVYMNTYENDRYCEQI
ncbi:motile sperm domain-containing protein 2-like [Zerene cesonia]|uniref:motile sperm domain-containing protein 2-like n=1 Tax=Zerene cesonia TaxID=33412 RepID=UPI0018E56A15|nr:motile sperm domain-containing protein 2-like [Zerene cesonia]